MTGRERLPNRRASEQIAFGDNLGYVATVSKFSDGRVAEIFLLRDSRGRPSTPVGVLLDLLAGENER
jgi:hypothetical protein